MPAILIPHSRHNMTLARWLKVVGDQISLGEPVAEMLTGSDVITIVSPSSGVLTQQLVCEGEVVAPNTAIARIDNPVEPTGNASTQRNVESPAVIDIMEALRSSLEALKRPANQNSDIETANETRVAPKAPRGSSLKIPEDQKPSIAALGSIMDPPWDQLLSKFEGVQVSHETQISEIRKIAKAVHQIGERIETLVASIRDAPSETPRDQTSALIERMADAAVARFDLERRTPWPHLARLAVQCAAKIIAFGLALNSTKTGGELAIVVLLGACYLRVEYLFYNGNVLSRRFGIELHGKLNSLLARTGCIGAKQERELTDYAVAVLEEFHHYPLIDRVLSCYRFVAYSEIVIAVLAKLSSH